MSIRGTVPGPWADGYEASKRANAASIPVPDIFSRDAIELRLRLHLINYQQACSGTREGEIRIARKLVIDEVVKLVGEARVPNPANPPPPEDIGGFIRKTIGVGS